MEHKSYKKGELTMKKIMYVGVGILGICTGTAFLIQAISNTLQLAMFGKFARKWNNRIDNLYRIAEPGLIKSIETNYEELEQCDDE